MYLAYQQGAWGEWPQAHKWAACQPATPMNATYKAGSQPIIDLRPFEFSSTTPMDISNDLRTLFGLACHTKGGSACHTRVIGLQNELSSPRRPVQSVLRRKLHSSSSRHYKEARNNPKRWMGLHHCSTMFAKDPRRSHCRGSCRPHDPW